LLQIVALLVSAVLAVNGLGLGTDLSAADLKLFRKTNLTTLVVWGLWWPGMIAAALVLGRAWCTVCPMELVNRIGDAAARATGLPRVTMGRWLRAGWLTLALYLVMQLLVAGVSIHRVPHFTAILLIALFSLALLTGLVFRQPRSFCTAFCPAAALLSVYGRFTQLQLSKRDPAVCDGCVNLDCVREENRHRLDSRSCPSMLRPYRRRPSDGCVLCLQCVKVCPHDNMGFGVVAEDAPVRQKALLRPYEAGFVMVALGFVVHEVIGEVKWIDAYFHVPPEWMADLVPVLPFGWFEALWFLVLFPLVVWALVAAMSWLAGHRAGWRPLLLAAATGAAPLIGVAHLAKAAAKVSSWSVFLPGSLLDPRGGETFQQIRSGVLDAPSGLLSLSLLGWVMLVLSLVIAWRTWHWASQLRPGLLAAARSGVLTSWFLFGFVLAIWGLPVGPATADADLTRYLTVHLCEFADGREAHGAGAAAMSPAHRGVAEVALYFTNSAAQHLGPLTFRFTLWPRGGMGDPVEVDVRWDEMIAARGPMYTHVEIPVERERFERIEARVVRARPLGRPAAGVRWGMGRGTTLPGSGWRDLAAGSEHVCAIDGAGQVSCWGENSFGVLDAPEGQFRQIEGGNTHSCAIDGAGEVSCWGWAVQGQTSPPPGPFREVEGGYLHACGLRGNGSIACWGLDAHERTLPPDGRFSGISVGWDHACALDDSGRLHCWGRHHQGGTVREGEFRSVAAGLFHDCALDADGAATCWDATGQPIDAVDGAFAELATGAQHTCGLRADGHVTCWGRDHEGQASPPEGQFVRLAAGDVFTCGLDREGRIQCWGVPPVPLGG